MYNTVVPFQFSISDMFIACYTISTGKTFKLLHYIGDYIKQHQKNYDINHTDVTPKNSGTIQ